MWKIQYPALRNFKYVTRSLKIRGDRTMLIRAVTEECILVASLVLFILNTPYQLWLLFSVTHKVPCFLS